MNTSEARIALAVQGGGMRSSYAMGALAALAENPLAKNVTSIVGTSGGALSAAYFICGKTEEGVDDFENILCSSRSISYRRFWKMVDVDFFYDDWLVSKRLPDLRDALATGPRLVVGLCRWPTGVLEYRAVGEDSADAYKVLKASSAIPIYYGRRVTLGDKKYVDGGIADPLPLFRASLENADLVIAIGTRALSELRTPEKGIAAAVVACWPRLGRGVRSLILDGNPLVELTDRAMSAIHARPSTRALAITPSDPERLTPRVCRDRDQVARCAAMGRDDMRTALARFGVGEPGQGAPTRDAPTRDKVAAAPFPLT